MADVGEAAELNRQLQILNRTVRWSSRGPGIEADPRFVKEVVNALGQEDQVQLTMAAAVAAKVEENQGSIY